MGDWPSWPEASVEPRKKLQGAPEDWVPQVQQKITKGRFLRAERPKQEPGDQEEGEPLEGRSIHGLSPAVGPQKHTSTSLCPALLSFRSRGRAGRRMPLLKPVGLSRLGVGHGPRTCS